MNFIRKECLLFALVMWLISSTECSSQIIADSLLIETSKDVNSYFDLPPLHELIDSAMKNSPFLRVTDMEQKRQESMLGIEKTSWTDLVMLNTNYNYGNNVSNVYGPGVPQSISITARHSFGVSGYLQIPISSIVNRKKRMRIATINYEEAKEALIAAKRDLRKLVTNLYIEVIMKKRVFILRSDALQSLDMSFHIAELEFKDNMISILDFSKVHEMYMKSQIEFEISRKNYLVALSSLENIAGIRTSLMR